MTTRMTIEDRLREALAATAALVHLEDQPQTVPARAPRRIGRYAPLAVAAAVLVILAGVVFGLSGGRSRSGRHTGGRRARPVLHGQDR
jgi:hypothetical protein